ncbi:MAG: hypothetical protein II407_09245 [Prevotella sp.]|nr:hypothetical protein [Prevotella sp.]MBR4921813.1 hypothetical protein [Prevotella sp.]
MVAQRFMQHVMSIDCGKKSEVTAYHSAVRKKFGYDECTPKSQGHLVVKRSA